MEDWIDSKWLHFMLQKQQIYRHLYNLERKVRAENIIFDTILTGSWEGLYVSSFGGGWSGSSEWLFLVFGTGRIPQIVTRFREVMHHKLKQSLISKQGCYLIFDIRDRMN